MKLENFKKSDVLVSLFVDSDGVKNVQDLNNCLYSVAKQKKSVDIAVLYNELSDEEFQTLQSIAANPMLHLLKKGENGEVTVEKTALLEGESLNVVFVKNDLKNFGQVFNHGFNIAVSCGYEFYSVIEQEDVVAVLWYDYVSKFFAEDPNTSVYLPLARNISNGIFTSLLNEAPWVEGLAEEAGTVDINLLLRYNVANILGAVFKVSSLLEYSEQVDNLYKPFKESMKVTHTYEFFLRMIYNDLKVRTLPRIGYELKFIGKPRFLETTSKVPQNIATIPPELGGMTPAQVQFYIDLAKKEYFFDNDRNIAFNS